MPRFRIPRRNSLSDDILDTGPLEDAVAALRLVDVAQAKRIEALESQPATLGYKVGKIERENPTVTKYGATGQGAVDDTPSFAAAITAVTVEGGSLGVPAGLYNIGRVGLPGIEIDSPIAGEPDTDQRSVVLRGSGAGNSVIKSMSVGQYAVKLTGGTAVDAHGYESHGDFSIVAGVAGSNGMHVFNKAYTQLQNMTLQGMNTGLLLESVLSSRFENVQCRNNAIYGAHLKKGSGFAGTNANQFDSCKFQSNVVLGLHSEAFQTGLVFNNCNFENNGRQGQPSEGGAELIFNGAEGRVGATFIGGYFESNGGGADLFLTNTDSSYVTVLLVGVTFNRNIAARFVTNCIKTTGKIRLVLIGCAFASYNGYTPNAGRPYISGDADLILTHDQCVFMDALEAPSTLSQTARLPLAGNVSSAGAAGRLPVGWTCSRLSAGAYRVTHNLAVASVHDYAVSAGTNSGAPTFVFTVTKGLNFFDVSTVNTVFASTDAAFDFTLTRI